MTKINIAIDHRVRRPLISKYSYIKVLIREILSATFEVLRVPEIINKTLFLTVNCLALLYASATGWSAITKIIARGEAEENYLICNRTSPSGIRVLYHATFNNMYNFQLCLF